MTRAKVNDMIRHTETYDTLHAGRLVAAGGVEILANLPNTRMWTIIIQNSPSGSTNSVFVGNQYIQPWEVIVGGDVTIPLDSTNKVYVQATAGDIVNWLAMG